jgi:hypothetical protein
MHREFVGRFGALDAAKMAVEAKKQPPNPVMEVGERRYEITVEMSGAFAVPESFANPLVLKVLAPLLGADMRLPNARSNSSGGAPAFRSGA